MGYILFSLGLGLIFAMVASNTNHPKAATYFGSAIVIISLIINAFVLMPTIAVWDIVILIEFGAVSMLALAFTPEFAFWRLFPLIAALFTTCLLAVLTPEDLRYKAYQKMLEVETVAPQDFKHDITPIEVEKLRAGDAELARKVAEDKLGEIAGLGSQVEIGKMTIQNISGHFTIDNGVELSFNNDLIWVAPLEHRSFRKWLFNRSTPGYVIVDAANTNKRYLVTEVNGQKLNIRYGEQSYLWEKPEFRIRIGGHQTYGLHDYNFEISPDGRPYWIVSTYVKTIGFSGEDATGVVTLDAQTGQTKHYDIASTPQWIDRIQPDDFVLQQITYWGKYIKGWANAKINEEMVQQPTPGITLVYSEGRSYWCTGIQSTGKDKSTSGFMLIDSRTKQAKYYEIGGVNEVEAVRIAQDQPFAKAANYKAVTPVWCNIANTLTYFMTFKGSSGNVVGYCFLSVSNRQAVGCGTSKQEAEQAYLTSLQQFISDDIAEGKIQLVTQKAKIKNIMHEGDTYYLLLEGFQGKEFYASSKFYPELRWSKTGDSVEVKFGEGSVLTIPLQEFDNLDFAF